VTSTTPPLAMVTGASAGIGYELAKCRAELGVFSAVWPSGVPMSTGQVALDSPHGTLYRLKGWRAGDVDER
jgi:hypothetical protein